MESAPRLRVALLWPRGFEPATTIPLPLAYLKANLPEHLAEVLIIDCALASLSADSDELARRLSSFDPDIVGVSSWSPMAGEALDLIRLAKRLRPDCITVLGGAHASSYAARCLDVPELDFVFRGEAERSFRAFVEQIKEGRSDWSSVPGLVWRRASGGLDEADPDRPEDLDELRPPDFAAVDLPRYQSLGYRWNSPPWPNAPLWVTRGCPYRCQYCAAPDLNGRPVRTHSVDYMRAEILRLYDQGVRWFNIIDDNFTYHVNFAKQFCRMVIDLGLPDVGFGTPNGIRMLRGDPELWELMKRAGWRHLIVAPESGSSDTLERMKKDLQLDRVAPVVREIQAAGLKCQAFFIIGYPGDRPEDIDATFRLITQVGFNFVFLANFQPLPGTPVYDQLVAEGAIEDGLLPSAFSDGVRVYTPDELRDFNFSRFILKTHLRLALSRPRNIPYQSSVFFRLYKPSFVGRKLLRTVGTMLRPAAQMPPHDFEPLHKQASRASLR